MQSSIARFYKDRARLPTPANGNYGGSNQSNDGSNQNYGGSNTGYGDSKRPYPADNYDDDSGSYRQSRPPTYSPLDNWDR